MLMPTTMHPLSTAMRVQCKANVYKILKYICQFVIFISLVQNLYHYA